MSYGHYLVRDQTTYHFRYTLPIWAIGNPKPIHVKRTLAIHDLSSCLQIPLTFIRMFCNRVG